MSDQRLERVRASKRRYRERNPHMLRQAKVRRRERLRQFLRGLKAGRPCVDCGGLFDPVCMDFDHRDRGAKLGVVSRMINTASEERVLAEVAKCDLVCANCHRLRTKDRGDWLNEGCQEEESQRQLCITGQERK